MTKSPTQILEEEHRIIEKVVAAAAALAGQLETGEAVETEIFLNIVDFMRTYADRCHHSKEEALLFPLLGEKGVPLRGCPIEALTREHVAGRALVKGLAESTDAHRKGDPGAKDEMVRNLRGIVDLYPSHIWKEDYLLFPMTNKVLSQEDQEHLFGEFEKVENEIGRDEHQRFQRLAEGFHTSAEETGG